MRVVVIGGGIIGLSSAYFLQAAGAEVILVESGEIGQAASLGNGGWITPVLAAPLPAPGAIKEGLAAMLRKHSPVVVRPGIDDRYTRWIARFVRSSSSARHLAGRRAMLWLGSETMDAYDELRDADVAFEEHRTGMTFAFRSEATFEHYAGQLCALPAQGYPGEVRVLSGDDARVHEPALSSSVIGAIHTTADGYVRPEALCAALLAGLRGGGVEIRERQSVDRLVRSGVGWQVDVQQDQIAADAVVVAAGAGSVGLLETIGHRMLLQPGKGHSLTSRGTGVAPTRALYFADRKVGLSAFDGGVRLAGLLELNPRNGAVQRRHIETLRVAASEFLADWQPGAPESAWAGMRTFAPDGLPIIGQVAGQPGVYVATGHGMMGITLGPATGRGIARMILDGGADGFEPFRVDRPMAVR